MFSRISKSLPVSFVVAFLLSVSPLLAQAPAIEVHFSEEEHCRDYRAAVSEARDPCLPDTNLTPGKVRPGWTLEMTEAKSGTQQYRHVPVTLKREVWHNYGYDTTVGPYDANHKDYEFDHLIPNCLGGASVKENVWPQPVAGPWNAHDKDKLEGYVRLQVLQHKITLAQAQAMFTPNWIETYKAQLGPKPEISSSRSDWASWACWRRMRAILAAGLGNMTLLASRPTRMLRSDLNAVGLSAGDHLLEICHDR